MYATFLNKHHTLFIINDDINLAKKISADGVHLGKNDASIQQAREQLGFYNAGFIYIHI
jgi:thiamine monophosphate synthase